MDTKGIREGVTTDPKYTLPLEIICLGTTATAEAAITVFADRSGLLYRSTEKPGFALREGRITYPGSDVAVGICYVEELPDRRTLIRLRLPRPGEEKLSPNQQPAGIISLNKRNGDTDLEGDNEIEFEAFCDGLVEELARLGFFELEGVARDPLGIRKQSTS